MLCVQRARLPDDPRLRVDDPLNLDVNVHGRTDVEGLARLARFHQRETVGKPPRPGPCSPRPRPRHPRRCHPSVCRSPVVTFRETLPPLVHDRDLPRHVCLGEAYALSAECPRDTEKACETSQTDERLNPRSSGAISPANGREQNPRAHFHWKWTNTRPKLRESFSTRWY